MNILASSRIGNFEALLFHIACHPQMAMSNFVLNFLCSLKDLKSIISDPFVAACILRMLDSTTSSLIFDLIRLNISFPALKAVQNSKESLSILLSLGLVARSDNRVMLDPIFRYALLQAFCLESFNRRFLPLQSQPAPVQKVADEKLHKILEFIASNTSIDLFGVQDILSYCGLISQQITNKGFEFLLLPRKDQMWFLVINSIKFYSKNSIEESEMFLSLVELLLKPSSGPFSTEVITNWYLFLDSIGAILITSKEQKNIIFYANPGIFYDAPKGNQFDQKFIILETNFKIYAYTSRAYDRSVLSLFSTTISVFPTLVRACFDEGSIISAFSKGITAKQIIKYLQDHSESVPRNVVNQINIWEQKLHRIRARNGYLYHDFIHLSDFYQVLKYVEGRGGLIYKDEMKRMIVAEERVHDSVREFIKEISK